MAVLGWIALGLVTALFASGFRAGDERRFVLVVRCVLAGVGALVGGLVAVAAGVGAIGDFFHTGTWLIALAGAILALFIHELARTSRGRQQRGDPEARSWAARRAGGESERLDRNW
jgi:hypothetical protein